MMDRRRQTDRPGEPDGQMRAKWTDCGGQIDQASHKHRLSVAHSFEINYFVILIESLSYTIAHATVDIYSLSDTPLSQLRQPTYEHARCHRAEDSEEPQVTAKRTKPRLRT